MGVLAGTWLSISMVMRSAAPGSTSKALGLLLFIASLALLVPAVGSALGKLIATAVLTVASIRFALTALYQVTNSNAWREAAGVAGLILCGIALYAGAAMLLEDARREMVLPTFRRAAGEAALEKGFAEQLRTIEREAGVREQL